MVWNNFPFWVPKFRNLIINMATRSWRFSDTVGCGSDQISYLNANNEAFEPGIRRQSNFCFASLYTS